MTTFQAIASTVPTGVPGAALQPFPDQPVDLSSVRAPIRIPHHGAHDRADRPVVAGADLLHCVGVLGHCLLDDRLELTGIRYLGEPLARDDRPGVSSLLD